MSKKLITDEAVLATLRKRNNPDNKPTGRFTGRCPRCSSNDLWDDASTYGCRTCGAIFKN